MTSNPIISHWLQQSMRLRMAHSGERVALHAHLTIRALNDDDNTVEWWVQFAQVYSSSRQSLMGVCTVRVLYNDWHLFAEQSETTKSSPPISDEQQKVPEAVAGCDEEPSSPTSSTVLPDSVASDLEKDVTDVAGMTPPTAEPDAWPTWRLRSFTALTTQPATWTTSSFDGCKITQVIINHKKTKWNN